MSLKRDNATPSYLASTPKRHHECELEKVYPPGRLRLPPNATTWQKFCYRFRLFCTPTEGRRSKAFFRSKSHFRQELKRCLQEQRWYTIHPISGMSELINWIMFIVWTFWLYTYPLFSISYVNFPIVYHVILKLLQIIVIASFFVTGYITTNNKIVIRPSEIIYHYLTTFFIFDLSGLVSITLYELMATLLWTKQNYMQNFDYYLYVFSWAMISLAVRIKTIHKILRQALSERNFSNSTAFIIMNTFKLFYVLHVTTCLFYLVPMAINNGKFPRDSWFYKLRIHNPQTPSDFVDLYLKCMIVCICTFLGAKYSYYKPTLTDERLTISVICFVGRVYTLFFIASLLQVFGVVGISESKYDQCLLQLNEYMNAKKLPLDLREKLLEFYKSKLKKRYFNEREILQNLSDVLRTELFLYSAKSLIQKTPLLRTLPIDVLGKLFALMLNENYLPGDIIAKAGNEIRYIYLIAHGTTVVYDEDGLELGHLKDGSDFGYLPEWVTKKSFYSFNYITIEHTEIYYIPVKVFADFFRRRGTILEWFEKKTRNRLLYYKNEIETKKSQRGESILAALNSGLLLESRMLRTFAHE